MNPENSKNFNIIWQTTGYGCPIQSLVNCDLVNKVENIIKNIIENDKIVKKEDNEITKNYTAKHGTINGMKITNVFIVDHKIEMRFWKNSFNEKLFIETVSKDPRQYLIVALIESCRNECLPIRQNKIDGNVPPILTIFYSIRNKEFICKSFYFHNKNPKLYFPTAVIEPLIIWQNPIKILTNHNLDKNVEKNIRDFANKHGYCDYNLYFVHYLHNNNFWKNDLNIAKFERFKKENSGQIVIVPITPFSYNCVENLPQFSYPVITYYFGVSTGYMKTHNYEDEITNQTPISLINEKYILSE